MLEIITWISDLSSKMYWKPFKTKYLSGLVNKIIPVTLPSKMYHIIITSDNP